MVEERQLRFLIAAGGTVGHVAPALAVAEALRQRGGLVTFAGSPDRVEARLVPEAGYEFDAFAISGLPRRPRLELVRAAGRALAAPSACLRILERRKPDAVLGAGGYVAGPMVLAARLRRIPCALTEADAHLGLANRLAAPLAERVFLAYPLGQRGAKYRPVGRPIPSTSRPVERAEARGRLGLPPEGPAVLVFGGSLGARLLNEIALSAWAEEGPSVIHLCGERDYPELQGRVSRPDYVLRPFLDEIGVAYGAADVALARAGGSVWELAAAGLPAVLVPGAFATAAHQEKNASWFADAGGAVVVPEAEAARGPQVVAELLGDGDRLAAMGVAMRRVAKPQAAEEIADELVELAGRARGRGRARQREKRAARGRTEHPLSGRRIWIAGIGGAGMSGYALLAHAWGAEVAGWDRVETPYLQHLQGIAVEISSEPPRPPKGWEAYVSTAFAGRVEGRSRADLLTELVALQRAIVVAGAHGKTTTSAMIAYCLDRLGLDPAFLIGGEVPQLGGNARAGSGWLVVEGDESDRSLAALHPEIAVLLNIDLDHHTTFGSRAELESFFEEWLREVPHVVRAEELGPVAFELAVRGEHNRRNAAAALAALELAGVARVDAEQSLAEFRGAGRRLEQRGEAGGVVVLDSYAHHPAELAADLEAVRDGGRVLALFQPHLYSRTRHLAHDFARALAAADAVCVTEIYPAREEPVAGVSGRLIVEELARVRPAMRIGWAPGLDDAARLVAAWSRPGDTILTLGAGDVDRAASLILEELA